MKRATVCAVGVAAAAAWGVPAAASSAPAHAARCSVSTGGPVLKNNTVFAFGRFCSPESRTETVTVLLEGRIDGKWTTIARVSKRLHMRAGKTYTLSTTTIQCKNTTRSIQMRTTIVLGTGPKHRSVLSNVGLPTTCV
jgi:hypothetical protein